MDRNSTIVLPRTDLTFEYEVFSRPTIPYSQPQDNKLARYMKIEMQKIWDQHSDPKVLFRPTGRPTVYPADKVEPALKVHRYRIEAPMSSLAAWESFRMGTCTGPEANMASRSALTTIVHAGPSEYGPLGTPDRLVLQPGLRVHGGCLDAAKAFLVDHELIEHICDCEFSPQSETLRLVGRDSIAFYPKVNATANRLKIVSELGGKRKRMPAMAISAMGTVEIYGDYAVGDPETWELCKKRLRKDAILIRDQSVPTPMLQALGPPDPNLRVRPLTNGGKLYYSDERPRENIRTTVARLCHSDKLAARISGSKNLIESEIRLSDDNIDTQLFVKARLGAISPRGPGFVYAMLACSPSMRYALEMEIYRSRSKFGGPKGDASLVITKLGRLDLSIGLKRPAVGVLAAGATKRFKPGDPPGLYLVNGVSQLVTASIVTPKSSELKIAEARATADRFFSI